MGDLGRRRGADRRVPSEKVSSNLIRAFCFAPNAKKNNREGFLVVRTSLAAQWEVLD